MKRQPRRIVLLRHAKAEQVGATDLDRELTPRGREDAAAAGRWLDGAGVVPERALVSAAVRTRQTWEALVEATHWATEAVFDRGLYSAGVETALDLVRETPEETGTLLLVGHNPTVAYLAHLLDDGEGDAEASREMVQGYPTSALAVLTFEGRWSDLTEAGARLGAFHVARR